MMRFAAFLAACLLAGTALAQSYPNRPVRIVIGFTPGGGVDINARLLAAKLSEQIGQQFVVENKPGAGTNIANEYVAKSTPDGYTLLFNSAAFAINLALYKTPPYALREFAPVSVFSESVNLLVVSASLPARNLKELVAMAKEKPGSLNYSSAGAGTTQHMAAELFKLRTGTDIVHVPYKGSAPALTALIAGEVQLSLSNTVAIHQHVKSGRLRAPLPASTTRTTLPSIRHTPKLAQYPPPSISSSVMRPAEGTLTSKVVRPSSRRRTVQRAEGVGMLAGIGLSEKSLLRAAPTPWAHPASALRAR